MFVLDDVALAAAVAAATEAAPAAAASTAASSWIWPMIASTAMSAGANMAQPKYGMEQPGQVPGVPQFDLNSLVQQAQQRQGNLPKLQLQSRL